MYSPPPLPPPLPLLPSSSFSFSFSFSSSFCSRMLRWFFRGYVRSCRRFGFVTVTVCSHRCTTIDGNSSLKVSLSISPPFPSAFLSPFVSPSFSPFLLGSDDGENWEEYKFSYKVNNDPYEKPAVIPIYWPRLDWHLWFLPLRYRRSGTPHACRNRRRRM